MSATADCSEQMMTKLPGWPRPYLIGLRPTKGTKIFLDLPDRKSFTDDVPGIGQIEVKVGGVPWDLEREFLRSIAGLVPSPISAIVSAHMEDGLDLLQQGPINIVSEKFRRIAERLFVDAEFLPMAVNFTPQGQRSIGGGAVVDNYYWLNSWGRVDVVDRSSSELFVMPVDEKDAFQPRGEAMFSAWDRLDLHALPAEPAYYGISGLFGGKRFISPEFHKEIKSAGLNLKFRPWILDVLDPIKTNDQEFEYREMLNA